MKIMIYLFSLVMLLSGCASNSGVIKTGEDTYKISRQASTGFEGSSRIKKLALQEAKQSCEVQGKLLHVVSIGGHHPPYILGNFPKVIIEFMCLEPSDTRLKPEELDSTQHSMQKTKTEADSMEYKIKTLNKLLADGLITKDEFNIQKNKLLNEFTSK